MLRPIVEVEEGESGIQKNSSIYYNPPTTEKELPTRDTIYPSQPENRFPSPDLSFGFGSQTDRFPEIHKEKISIIQKSSPRLVKKSTRSRPTAEKTVILKQSRPGLLTMQTVLPLNSDSQNSSTTRHLFPDISTERRESFTVDPTANPYTQSRNGLGSIDIPIQKSAMKNSSRSRSPSLHDSPRKVPRSKYEYSDNIISNRIIEKSTSPRELRNRNDDLSYLHAHLRTQGEDTSMGAPMFRRDTFASGPG
jgi:hypothetical protein